MRGRASRCCLLSKTRSWSWIDKIWSHAALHPFRHSLTPTRAHPFTIVHTSTRTRILIYLFPMAHTDVHVCTHSNLSWLSHLHQQPTTTQFDLSFPPTLVLNLYRFCRLTYDLIMRHLNRPTLHKVTSLRGCLLARNVSSVTVTRWPTNVTAGKNTSSAAHRVIEEISLSIARVVLILVLYYDIDCGSFCTSGYLYITAVVSVQILPHGVMLHSIVHIVLLLFKCWVQFETQCNS